MDISILIARIAAVTYLASGIALINGSLNLKKTYKEMEKSSLFMTIMGMLTTLLGMLIINFHNIWVKDWPVLVTVIGWILLVEGFLYIANPKILLDLFKKLPKSQVGWGIFTLGMAAVFGYFGFVA